MKRFTLLLLSFSLVVSAVPAGAVFATGVEVEAVITDDAMVDVEEAEDSPDSFAVETIEVADVPVSLSVEGEDANDELSVSVGVATDVVITEVQTRSATSASSELIELFNGSNQPQDVTGWCLKYASASGASYNTLACVKSGGTVPSTRVILAAKSHLVLTTSDRKTDIFTPDMIFSGTLPETGGRLRLEDEYARTVDMVGWGRAMEYLGQRAAPAPPEAMPLRSLQRVMIGANYQNATDNFADFVVREAKTIYQTGALSEVTDVCPNIAGLQLLVPDGTYHNKRSDCIDKATVNFCPGIMVNEIGANIARQFIEITNASNTDVSLAGCRIMTNRSATAAIILPEVMLLPGAYYTVYLAETALKLTKTTTGTVYILASDGETEVNSRYYEDLSSETSWAYFADGWKQTFLPTPEGANVYEQYAQCAEGYMRNITTGRCNKAVEAVALIDCGEGRERNPITGRCRNMLTTKELAPCKEGQYRSEETNRCRLIASAVSALKPCADDQFRNPETNRCKKIASVEELVDCGEGRERNPETNRCRNIVTAAMPTAAFAPEVVTQTAQSTLGWWALGGVTLIAFGYAGWQWRFEVRQLLGRIGQALNAGPKS